MTDLQNSPEAVIFDLGGTITVSAYTLFEDYSRSLGITMAAFGTVFRNGDDALARMERGEMSMADFMDYVCRTVGAANGITLDPADLERVIRKSLHPDPAMVEMVRQIRRHHKVAILTNNNAELAGFWRGLLPKDFVDVIVESFAERMRKPDRKIYELTANRLGSPMDACVFIDDQADNVNAAREFGMGAVIFESQRQCQEELIALGVRMALE